MLNAECGADAAYRSSPPASRFSIPHSASRIHHSAFPAERAMPRIADLLDLGPPARDDDEGLFSRDMKGRLVRLDTPTEKDYDRQVTLTIAGQPVTVPAAEPLKDAQGNVVLDIENKTTPRFTTIYDAAEALYVKE